MIKFENVNGRVYPDEVVLSLRLAEAEALRDAVADVLCWCRGFGASSGGVDHGPMGVNALVDLNLALKRDIDRCAEHQRGDRVQIINDLTRRCDRFQRLLEAALPELKEKPHGGLIKAIKEVLGAQP